MTGFTLGQPYGVGRTQQSTITPGLAGAAVPPAAGAGYTFVLQRYDYWRLIGASFTLVTDANAGNRYVQIQYPDGTAVPTMRDISAFAQVASKTVNYSAGLDGLIAQDGATAVTASFRLSGHWLEVGRSVVLAIVGVQVGDQLSNIRLTFDRTLVDEDGSERIRGRELEQEIDQELEELAHG